MYIETSQKIQMFPVLFALIFVIKEFVMFFQCFISSEGGVLYNASTTKDDLIYGVDNQQGLILPDLHKQSQTDYQVVLQVFC